MLKASLKHPMAVYYDDDKRRRELFAVDLNNNVNGAYDIATAYAEKGKLFDYTEQIPLSVKPRGQKRAHFYSKAGVRSSIRVDCGERNDVHDAHVRDILARLQSRNDWKWEIGSADLSDYVWKTEVVRMMALSPMIAVRHDLFGHPIALHATSKRPSVAIEVINCHYPEPAGFDAALAVSATLPIVIFFDVVDRGNKFFKIDDKTGVLRPRFTIHSGKVWDYAKPTQITTRSVLKRHMQEVRR